MTNWNTYQIEMTVMVSDQATFDTDLTKSVDFTTWNENNEFARHSDYLLELVVQAIHSTGGLIVQSASVGKLLDAVRLYNVAPLPKNQQPTLWEEENE